MICKNCTKFLTFPQGAGIQGVNITGMCMAAGADDSTKWVPKKSNEGCCIDGITPIPKLETIRPGPLNPNVRQILDNAKAYIEEKKAQGACGDCSSWRRKGFSDDGECWYPGSDRVTKTSIDNCQNFFARPNDKALVGDIVEIIYGDQWQIIHAGKKYVMCADKNGEERVFELKGLRFKKCLP